MKINIKLPSTDFFTEYAKTAPISSFGRESRDIALSYVNNFNTVIDIGAHAGISVLHWAKQFNKVIGYEPMLDHFNCLKENTKDLSNVEIFNYAISDKQGTLTGAYRTIKNSGSFQILDESYVQPKKKPPRDLYEIKSYRLDDFLFDNVDLIKVDVEGWEYEVLLGAIETIKKHSPVLMIEFTGGNSKKSLHSYNVDEYYSLIKDLKYVPVAQSGDDTIYIKESI